MIHQTAELHFDARDTIGLMVANISSLSKISLDDDIFLMLP
jgi:hypothetical protein